VTPFTDKVPGLGWIKSFKGRHLELSMRKPQDLELKRAQNLCAKSVGSFYDNLQKFYNSHNYEANHIWNCDESGVQAGKVGGGYVIAKKGSKEVHKVILDLREWLSVLSCINATGEYLPNFYIFKGRGNQRFSKKNGREGGWHGHADKSLDDP